MKKRSIVLVFVVLITICSNLRAFDVVRDGNSVATVVVPKFDANSPEKKWTLLAANWFVDYVKKASGAQLKIAEEGQSVTGNIISIGHTNLAKAANIQTDKLKWNTCLLMVKGNTLFLIGRDSFGPGNDDDKGAKGTCKAVMTFLQDFVGVKWFIPSPMGELIPQNKNIAVPDDLSKTVTPVFAYAYGGGKENRFGYKKESPGAIANNLGSSIILMEGAHGWREFVPYEKYYKEHPEYFALIGGKRVGNEWNHLCTTNPEVKKILINEIRKKFDEGYEMVPLGQSDGYRPCECNDCNSLDNYKWGGLFPKYCLNEMRQNPCERINLLHKAIIDACKQSHPDKKVLLLVYAPTMWPSKKFDNYGDNVVANVCHYYPYTQPVWKSKVSATAAYLYWWGLYHPGDINPKFGARQAAEGIRFLRDNGYIGLTLDGGGHNYALEGAAYYTMQQLLGNPDLDPNMCVKQYCDFIYGDAGDTMVQFFNALYDGVSQAGDYTQTVWTWFKKADPNGKYEFELPSMFYMHYLKPELVTNLDKLLVQAQQEVKSERAKGWLTISKDQFEYLKASIAMYNRFDLYCREPDFMASMQMSGFVKKWKEARDKLLNYGKDKELAEKWFPEFTQVKDFFDSGGYGLSKIDKPVTIDFERIKKTHIR